jgi:hypothetical protein
LKIFSFPQKNCPIEKNTHPFKIIELKIFSFPKQNCPIEKNTHPFKIIDLKIFSFPKQNCPIEKNTHPFKIIDLKIFSFPQQKLSNSKNTHLKSLTLDDIFPKQNAKWKSHFQKPLACFVSFKTEKIVDFKKDPFWLNHLACLMFSKNKTRQVWLMEHHDS